MVKFVVAGRVNCPYYAKCEMVADHLVQSLTDFEIHKIVLHPDDWKSWLQTICTANKWQHENSPIIWRELVDRGGKGSLLGGFNEFMEYVQGYYGYVSDMQTDHQIKTGKENFMNSIIEQDELSAKKRQIKPMSIWISGALHTACSILIPILISGEIFGENQLINLSLLDNEGSMSLLNGLQMEVEDMACPLLHKVSAQNSLRKAFMDADIIIILDDIALDENQPIEDSYKDIVNLYQDIGVRIDTFAKSGVRVIVAGDHVLNLKIHNLLQGAFSIDHNNIIALSTQLEGEAKALLARKLKVNTQDVENIIVWGNIGRTTYIDLHKARVHRYESAVWGPADFSLPVMEIIKDRKWIETEFQEAVHSHRTTLRQIIKHPIGSSLAIAIYKVLKYWYFDSPPGEILSLGVISKGEFNIPADIIFSMPVRFCGGKWVIQTNIKISKVTQRKLQYIVQELKMEESFDFSPITEMHMGSSLTSVEGMVQEEDKA
ncbi:putative malate dehydrogenase 1B [Leucoraja erinacea]|uniref:putative malate dehydrogenase 1B n=1 Tax=Leucoraja erinaceus TaxID=7782 RepID=UPI0024590EB3|nr:putative malate dehydrogenase 1B [Leucoraja erinacea]